MPYLIVTVNVTGTIGRWRIPGCLAAVLTASASQCRKRPQWSGHRVYAATPGNGDAFLAVVRGVEAPRRRRHLINGLHRFFPKVCAHNNSSHTGRAFANSPERRKRIASREFLALKMLRFTSACHKSWGASDYAGRGGVSEGRTVVRRGVGGQVTFRSLLLGILISQKNNGILTRCLMTSTRAYYYFLNVVISAYYFFGFLREE